MKQNIPKRNETKSNKKKTIKTLHEIFYINMYMMY